MKKLSYGLLSALLLLSACAKETGEESQWDGPVLELNVACLEPTGLTKAGISGTEAGENSYHENEIKSVDFFFYPGGATSEPATYHIRYNNLGKRGNAVFRVELSTNDVNYKIFPAQSGITEATVYALANLPNSLMAELDLLEDQEETSMDRIGQLMTTTDFVGSTYTNHRQDQFIMSGTATITLTGRSHKMVAQGLVGLERYACKITVGIKMDNPMAVETGRTDEKTGEPIYEYWTPRPQEMQIYLVDGMSKMALSGTPAGKGMQWEPVEADYLDYRGNPMRFYNGAGQLYLDKVGEYYQTFPMYTYPYHWQSGSIEDGSREPYLKLVLPWDRQADQEHGISAYQHEFYYKILIPQDTRGKEYENSFVRNNWYHYDISVGVLGSETNEAMVSLEASMFIVYWQDKDVVIKQVSIGNARYLSVEHEEYVLNNQDGVDVRYTTSNPIEITDIHVTRPYYGENPSDGQEKYGATVRQVVGHEDAIKYDDIYPEKSWYLDYSKEQRKALNNNKEWLEDVDGVIRYTHKLNNNYQSDSFDYSPYNITFTVAHADSKEAWMREYDKHVTIIQKPGLYIQTLPNPDTWKGETGPTTPDHWGYVYVNNDQFTRARFDAALKEVPQEQKDAWKLDHIWRVVHYSSGGTDMYRIDVSVLPDLSDASGKFEFVLGDPRQSTPVNLREGLESPYNEPFATAPAIEGGERSLLHYYPTEASERTRHMLAPAYRISTKLSGSEYDGTPMEQAKMRCASLQESGFPAGRWRIPTEAEIRFISNLSAHGVFEWQFGGTYWSANGAVKVDKNNKTVTPAKNVTVALLRCVYDSWYWGDDRVLDSNDLPSIFTWGDKER